MDLRPPRLRRDALLVWDRNVRVWRKLIIPALLMNLGEPAFYLLGLGFGLGMFIGQMNDMPYLTFLATGIIASSAMNTASFEGMYSVFTRMDQQGTYDAMLATPLEVDDIIAGEMLWCATKAAISGVAILGVGLALGALHGWTLLWVAPVVFLVGLCFAGPAIVMAALSPSYDFFTYYFTLAVTPMFILCGVFYPITSLPPVLQGFAQLLPLTHAVALVRPIAAGLPLDNLILHLLVLTGYALAGFYLAVVLVRRRLIV